MRILAATHSSFPRVGEGNQQQRLRRAYADLEKGRISTEEFKAVEDSLVAEIIRIQQDAGIDIITDGLIRWYDHASHLARNLRGFEINGLLRFFDTNTYYRQPIATDSIGEGDGFLPAEIEYLKANAEKPVKAVLLGPLSMARMSLNSSSFSFEKLCLKLGEILSKVVAQLVSSGATVIQIEEPSLVRQPQDFSLFAESFSKIRQGIGRAQLLLAFYFGDANKIFDSLMDIPADIIGIDFTYSPGLLERIASDGSTRRIAFGLLDGRNTRMESADDIARSLEKPLGRIAAGNCHLTTSCGLEFLPRDYAIKKLKLTAEITRLLNG